MLNGSSVIGFGDEAVSPPTDPRELPSSRSAIALVEGQPGAIWKAAGHTLLRSGLIGSGLYVLGADRGPHLWIRALGAGVAIEVFALGWVLVHRRQAEQTTPPQTPEMLTPVLNPVSKGGVSLVGPQYLTKYTTTAYQMVALPDSAKPVMLCSYVAYFAADATDLGSSNSQLVSFRAKYETPVESLYGIKGRRWIVVQRKRFFDPKTFKELPSDTIFESPNKFPVPTSPDLGVPCG